MAKPIFKITNFGELANKRVLSITVTDEQGINSDKVQIRLDDRDYKLQTPQRGTIFDVYLGYEYGGPGLTKLGTFQLDEIKFLETQACIMEVSGNAQYHVKNEIKAPKSQSWDEKTLGEILGAIATRNGYEPAIDGGIANIFVAHLDQTTESDIAFATRIADSHDCFVKFQDGRMIVRPRSKAEGMIYIIKGINTSFSMENLSIAVPMSITATISSRTKYGSVRAYWHNPDEAKRVGELAGSIENEGGVYEMRETYETKAKALQAAEAKLAELKRGTGTIDDLQVPGDPNIRAGMKLFLEGFRPDICGEWYVKTVSQNLTGTTFTTSMSADREQPPDESGGEELINTGDDNEDEEEAA